MAFRYFIELQFNGRNFHGWQYQPNAATVQGELNTKLSLLINEKAETVGAGRTDTGVHAKYFVAHFDTCRKLNNLSDLTFKLNKFLHEDVFVLNIHLVPKDAHARFSTVSRTYKYYISSQKNVFNKDLAWQLFYDLKIELMNMGAAEIMKHTDFSSFSKHHTNVKTNTCNVYNSAWTREDNFLIYTITADRFLRNMVRSIVGTLVSMGKGKLSLDEFIEIINAKDRSKAGESAPAQGLFLFDIQYKFPFS